jgi:hypothetical protein
LIAAAAGVAVSAAEIKVEAITSVRRQILLAVLGVAFLTGGIVMAVRDDDDGPAPVADGEPVSPPTFSIPFEDDFSTNEHGWPSGGYGDGVYHLEVVRGANGSESVASPRDASSDADRQIITVKAHKTGVDAEVGYGYGMFCRGDGETRFYAFTIWRDSTTLVKNISGNSIPLAEANHQVKSAVEYESWKELTFDCETMNGGSAVELRVELAGQLILSGVDPDTCEEDPCGDLLVGGSFGLRAILAKKGEPDDELEVTFDNFAVDED